VPRPSQPLITREAAIRTALEIIDKDGVAAFGVQRLAAEMGVKAPSLYHHFEGKEEILTQVARMIIREVEPPPSPTASRWQEWFVDIATRLRRVVLSHPKAAPLLIEYFPRGYFLSTYERSALFLQRVGVPVEFHALLLDGLDKLSFGAAIMDATALSNGDTGLFPGVDPNRDPALSAAIEANPWTGEALFKESIRRFVQGVVDAPPPKPHKSKESRSRRSG